MAEDEEGGGKLPCFDYGPLKEGAVGKGRPTPILPTTKLKREKAQRRGAQVQEQLVIFMRLD